MSAGPIVWVLCSEIQPLKSREFGIACSTMTNWITCAIVGATFLSLVDTLGSAHTFWLYAFLNGFFIVLTSRRRRTSRSSRLRRTSCLARSCAISAAECLKAIRDRCPFVETHCPIK